MKSTTADRRHTPYTFFFSFFKKKQSSPLLISLLYIQGSCAPVALLLDTAFLYRVPFVHSHCHTPTHAIHQLWHLTQTYTWTKRLHLPPASIHRPAIPPIKKIPEITPKNENPTQWRPRAIRTNARDWPPVTQTCNLSGRKYRLSAAVRPCIMIPIRILQSVLASGWKLANSLAKLVVRALC